MNPYHNLLIHENQYKMRTLIYLNPNKPNLQKVLEILNEFDNECDLVYNYLINLKSKRKKNKLREILRMKEDIKFKKSIINL
jgi:hypothetical protein